MKVLITADEVTDQTGTPVTAAAVKRATAEVATVSGARLGIADADPWPYSARDLRLLRDAVMWQAAYATEHPEAATRDPTLASASTNGAAFSLKPDATGDGLAPLARMSVRRLSWRRSRTQRVHSESRPTMAQTLVSDGSDASWRPL